MDDDSISIPSLCITPSSSHTSIFLPRMTSEANPNLLAVPGRRPLVKQKKVEKLPPKLTRNDYTKLVNSELDLEIDMGKVMKDHGYLAERRRSCSWESGIDSSSPAHIFLKKYPGSDTSINTEKSWEASHIRVEYDNEGRRYSTDIPAMRVPDKPSSRTPRISSLSSTEKQSTETGILSLDTPGKFSIDNRRRSSFGSTRKAFSVDQAENMKMMEDEIIIMEESETLLNSSRLSQSTSMIAKYKPKQKSRFKKVAMQTKNSLQVPRPRTVSPSFFFITKSLSAVASGLASAYSSISANGLPYRLSPPTPHSCASGNCRRIVINVCGQKFETQLGTLERYPDTLLGDPEKRAALWDSRRNEYFIDRHRASFQAILYFYQSGGRLDRPSEVPEDVFFNELIFYQLGDDVIASYKRKEHYPTSKPRPRPSQGWKRRLWDFTEEPQSGILARAYAFLSVACIFVSVMNFCIETLPQFDYLSCTVPDSIGSSHNSLFYNNGHLDYFYLIEVVTVIWFTLELILRFIACPSRTMFFMNLFNLFDIVAVVPFYIVLIFHGIFHKVGESVTCESARPTGFYIIFSLLRVLRIFKLAKHSRGLRVLGLTVKTSMHELWVFFFFLAVGTIIFSAVAYHAELGESNTPITSIPHGFWWAIVSLTTVGYGDVTPVGFWGKLVGSVCVITGVLTVALPVPVVVANFNNIYRYERQMRQGNRGHGGPPKGIDRAASVWGDLQ